MTDLYIEPVEDKPRWYQRRGPQVAVAGGVTAVLAFTGFGINAASGTESDPQEAVAEAAANLKTLPASVTITGGEQNPGAVTLTQTDAGVQVSLTSDELGGTLDIALIGETLFVRVDAEQLSEVTANPMLALAVAQYPAIGALLKGEWVSLDVSQDSEVLAALRDAQEAEVGDPDSMRAAADELRTALVSVGDDVRPSLVDALKDNATVTAVDDATGPAGSDHYRVTVDADQVKSDLAPVLRDAFDQVMQALDTFVADVGDQLPDGGAGQWDSYRDQFAEDFDAALAEPAEEDPVIDVWIADGEFTRISTAETTITFNADPTLDAPQTAVSLDQDLLNALPLIEQYGNGLMGQGLGLQGLTG